VTSHFLPLLSTVKLDRSRGLAFDSYHSFLFLLQIIMLYQIHGFRLVQDRANRFLGNKEWNFIRSSTGHGSLFLLTCLLFPRHFIHLSSLISVLSIPLGSDIPKLSLSNDKYGTLPYLLWAVDLVSCPALPRLVCFPRWQRHNAGCV
jgi:hypothetical protein